ncbi:MAG: tetratricopeptide repeat protein [Candidatus Omnitrophica bacterium]|nr:tetratricopeptide repeat protein [Candidatus Omnitrophota bacterium]
MAQDDKNNVNKKWEKILLHLNDEESAMQEAPIDEIYKELELEGVNVEAFIKKFEEKREEIRNTEPNRSFSPFSFIEKYFHSLIQLFLNYKKPVFSLGLIIILAVIIIKAYYPINRGMTYRDQEVVVFEKIKELDQELIILNQKGKYDEAIPIARQIVYLLNQHAGERHPDTAKALNNLAVLYKEINDYNQAEKFYLRALNIQSNVLEEGNEDTIATLNNLGLLYEKMMGFEKAESLYKDIIAIQEKRLGLKHPKTIQSRENLKILYDVIEKQRNQ